MSEQQRWTYTSEDGTYAVDSFTDEGKYAFVLILEEEDNNEAATTEE